ncbi:MAG: UDP-N-acetylmuramate dehydrogenase [Acidimicrobiia bacterium]
MTIESLVAQGLLEENVPLGPLTTYKSGGPARLYARPEGPGELSKVAGVIKGLDLPILVLGRGSNLLVADNGFPGVTIHMAGGFAGISYCGLEVTAGAGAPLPRVARGSVDAGIAGLEFLVGVPGSVGGAVRQNAGCFGLETGDRLVSADIVAMKSGDTFTLGVDSLGLGYRQSNLEPDWVVISAVFAGTGTDVSGSGDELRRITRWRKGNQPGGTLNAGSVFKNPPGTTAGYLIDSAGLKGFAIGEVSVSEKHANFFVATQQATSRQIRDLIFEVRAIVAERTGVLLEPEIEMVGFDDDD